MSPFDVFIGFCIGVASLSAALIIADILTRRLDLAIEEETRGEDIARRAQG